MRDALPEIRRRRAELIIVGNGQPRHAIDFRDTEQVKTPLYVDPELHAYAAAGLKRGLRSSLEPRCHPPRAPCVRRGQAPRGDPWQQGGVFIIRPDNRVDFSYISGEAGDHPSTEAILSAPDKRGRKKDGPPQVLGSAQP